MPKPNSNYRQSKVRDTEGKSHRMSLTRSIGNGEFSKITEHNPTPYQKDRARRTRLEAQFREQVLTSMDRFTIRGIVVAY